MPTIADTQGSGAVDKVKRKLGTSGGVMSAITAVPRGPGDSMDFTSCALTAKVVIDAIFDSKEGKTVAVFPMAPGDRVKKISQLLEQAHVLYVSISPDHHFVVIPTGAGGVAVMQAFQGSYRLDEWLDNSNNGAMTLSEFARNLQDLTKPTGGTGTIQPAAVALFGYRGKEADIRTWFPSRVEIKAVQYYRLAGGGGRRDCCVIM